MTTKISEPKLFDLWGGSLEFGAHDTSQRLFAFIKMKRDYEYE